MPAYLLDTNHFGQAFDGATVIGQRVDEARLAGLRLGTCLPVLCEIEAGLRQVRRKAQYRHDLDQLLKQLRVWPMNRKTSQVYGEIHAELRRLGKVLSQVDMMIAALARQLNLTILTTDRDFDAIADIRTADWSVK